MDIQDYINQGEYEWSQSTSGYPWNGVGPRRSPDENYRLHLMRNNTRRETNFVIVRGAALEVRFRQGPAQRLSRMKTGVCLDHQMTFRCVQGGGEARPRGALGWLRCITNYVGRLK